jgi:methyl-accepting chemotaxis protein
MIEIFKAESPDSKSRVADVLAATDFSKQTAVLIRYSRHGDPDEVSDLLHNLNGALRSFRYLAEKVKQGYDKDDVRGQKMMASIDRHVDGLNDLKSQLIDRIFGS